VILHATAGVLALLLQIAFLALSLSTVISHHGNACQCANQEAYKL